MTASTLSNDLTGFFSRTSAAVASVAGGVFESSVGRRDRMLRLAGQVSKPNIVGQRVAVLCLDPLADSRPVAEALTAELARWRYSRALLVSAEPGMDAPTAARPTINPVANSAAMTPRKSGARWVNGWDDVERLPTPICGARLLDLTGESTPEVAGVCDQVNALARFFDVSIVSWGVCNPDEGHLAVRQSDAAIVTCLPDRASLEEAYGYAAGLRRHTPAFVVTTRRGGDPQAIRAAQTWNHEQFAAWGPPSSGGLTPADARRLLGFVGRLCAVLAVPQAVEVKDGMRPLQENSGGDHHD